MHSLVWRPRAHLNRESIAIHLGLERGNPKAALSAIKLIDAAIAHVCEFPDSGGYVHIGNLRRAGYRRVLAEFYVVYYRFDEDEVVVYRMLHQRCTIDDYALSDF